LELQLFVHMILFNKVARHLGVDVFACNKDNFFILLCIWVLSKLGCSDWLSWKLSNLT